MMIYSFNQNKHISQTSTKSVIASKCIIMLLSLRYPKIKWNQILIHTTLKSHDAVDKSHVSVSTPPKILEAVRESMVWEALEALEVR